MVDHGAGDQTNTTFLWHSVKNASILHEYWMIQEDYTIFPKCVTKK